jgi:DNA (cytosine-5)-methyltransferase 1
VNLVDLCCGAGGLSLGMMMAGHTVVAAYDHDADTIATYQRNLGNHAHIADIRDLRGDDLPDCDGIVGGPPCQPFSDNVHNSRKGPANERNLIPDFVRLVLEKRPAFFLMENVPGLLNYKAFLAQQLARLEAIGYFPVVVTLNASYYGVPQDRRRVFIAGRRDGRLPVFPAMTNSRRDAVTTRQAIGYLLIESEAREIARWIRRLDGAPDKLVDTKNRATRSGSRYFRWRTIDAPAMTVTTQAGQMRVLMGGKNWILRARHYSVLQSFPTDWVWTDREETAVRLIGNAVPPLLAWRLGQAFDARLFF